MNKHYFQVIFNLFFLVRVEKIVAHKGFQTQNLLENFKLILIERKTMMRVKIKSKSETRNRMV